MLTDSHAHLDVAEFDDDRDEVIRRAKDGGVSHIITVAVDLESSKQALEIARNYNGIYAACGFHPHNARKISEEAIQELKEMASDKKIVAWGEIGLDFHKNYSPKEVQLKAFEWQLGIAHELGLPVIIHDREAHEDVLSIVKQHGNKGVIHCFSGDHELAKRFIDAGFYISIPGTVTYRKATKIRKVVTEVPLDFLLVETDCPFLSPHQKRGKRNEPLFVKFVAQEIALLKGLDLEEVAHTTSSNAKRLFQIDET